LQTVILLRILLESGAPVALTLILISKDSPGVLCPVALTEKYSFLFCVLEYFTRITKQQYNKRKKTKKTFKFPKIVKVK